MASRGWKERGWQAARSQVGRQPDRRLPIPIMDAQRAAAEARRRRVLSRGTDRLAQITGVYGAPGLGMWEEV